MTSVSHATIGASRRRGSISAVCPAVCLVAALVLSLAPCAAAQLATSSGVTQRYGNFSIVWPAQPRLVQQQTVSGGTAAIYAVIGSPYTYTFSFLQFSSPQETVTPQDFARNQTSNPPGETILSVSATKLAGYPADEVIYRIGQETHMAWSVQPTPEVNYVITAAGADSAAFRQRARQFAASFGKAGNRE
jgi:hypothetical protein